MDQLVKETIQNDKTKESFARKEPFARIQTRVALEAIRKEMTLPDAISLNICKGRQRSDAPQDFPCVNSIQGTIIQYSYLNRETRRAFGPPHRNSEDHCHCRSRADCGRAAEGKCIAALHLLPAAAESFKEEILDDTLSACTKHRRGRLKAEFARIYGCLKRRCRGADRASFGVGAVGPVHRLEVTHRKRLAKN